MNLISPFAFAVSPSAPVRSTFQRRDFGAQPLLQKQQQFPGRKERSLKVDMRGGAIPGWATYNEKLETNPLTTKVRLPLFRLVCFFLLFSRWLVLFF